MNGIVAPMSDPEERADLQGRTVRVHDSRPLGAAMRSSGFFLLSGEKYCPNGGIALPHHGGGYRDRQTQLTGHGSSCAEARPSSDGSACGLPSGRPEA